MPRAGDHRTHTLCRSCSAMFAFEPGLTHCPACGGTQLVHHAELDTLAIAHVDCDAFFASVEQRDDPSLTLKPLIVGGTGGRGVVAACCYQARRYGVRSAMPMSEAVRKCPDAVVVAPNMAKYSAASKQVRTHFERLTPAVEPLSIDEAFLDMSGTVRLHGAPPAAMLVKLAQDIQADVGVPVSIGLSYNKFLAKIASDLDKPQGFAVIGRHDAPGFLKKQPVSIIWGVGDVTAQRLKKDGINTIADLLKLEEAHVRERYGQMGQRLYTLGQGHDPRTVQAPTTGTTKALSHETTFAEDKSTFEDISPNLWQICEKVAFRLRSKHIAAKTITLKLKTAQFKNLTRSKTLNTATDSAYLVYETCVPLLKSALQTAAAFRLLGVATSNFTKPEQDLKMDLFAEENQDKRRDLEVSMDQLREKFGQHMVQLGRGLEDKTSGKS